MGSAITGENEGDMSGHDLGFSAGGTVVAISATKNDADGTDKGHVRVYKWSGTAWQQRGLDIDGDNDSDEFGHAADLNQDGSVLAVTSILHDSGGNSNVGHVRVFEWDGSSWNQKGNDIVGSAAEENVGWDVSLSADGNTMIVGIPNKPNTDEKGQIVVYEWSGSVWQQKGSALQGDISGEKVGKKVSISGDGTKIAFISSLENNDDVAYVSSWVNNDWSDKIYTQIYGTTSVDLSSDGSTLVVGAAENDDDHLAGTAFGSVKVFDVSDIEGDGAIIKGADLKSFYSGTDAANIGSDVSISADGTTVALGAKLADDGSSVDHGQVAVFDWTGSAWRLRDNILGDFANDEIGHAVKISEDGLRLAVSSKVILDKGLTSMYEWDSTCGSLSQCCVELAN